MFLLMRMFPPPNDGGLAHPVPPPALRWMGMDGPSPVASQASGDAANSHSADGPAGDNVMSEAQDAATDEMVVQNVGAEVVDALPVQSVGLVIEPAQPGVVVPSGHQENLDAIATESAVPALSVDLNVTLSGVRGASLADEVIPPMIVVPQFPPGFEPVMVKVNNIPLLSFSHLPVTLVSSIFMHIKHLFFDLDTVVPAFISDTDTLCYLAQIAYDPLEQEERVSGFIGPLPRVTPALLADQHVDDDVQEIAPPLPSSSTSRKRRRKLLKEPLDVAFLRRSARLNQGDGFRSQESAATASLNPSSFVAQPVDTSVVPPHLSVDNIQGIASNFLKMPLADVSATALLELDDDAVNPDV